ncbi:MAG: hypothetical protein KI786_00335 [Mameliella sp.]|nr:hypothetical protein [Phaeodactylibacter sp.]
MAQATRNAIQLLRDLSAVINALPDQVYHTPIKHLSNGTIGQHTRHIIECYQCLVSQLICVLQPSCSRNFMLNSPFVTSVTNEPEIFGELCSILKHSRYVHHNTSPPLPCEGLSLHYVYKPFLESISDSFSLSPGLSIRINQVRDIK